MRRWRETHVPAQHSQAEEEARLPQSHAHSWRQSGHPQSSPARPHASQRLTWRIRDRATFEALAGTRRTRRGPLSVRYVAVPGDTDARVAYAIGRDAGSAVRRNRIRRRLRAAIARAEARGQLPAGAYLLGAGPEVLTMPFTELERGLDELLGAAAGGPPVSPTPPVERPTIPARVLAVPIHGWRVLSTRLPSRCRFHPSCSAYALEALARHGAARGTLLAVRRVGRCHPWNPGGLDPVPSPHPNVRSPQAPPATTV